MSSPPLRQRTTTSSSAVVDSGVSSLQPPLPPPPPPPQATTTTALSQALQTSANLANLLPTFTLLSFQLLTPIFTSNGSCDAATRPMTVVLLVLLSLSCFLASFTDSVKGSDGRVYYGFITRKGLWLFDKVAAEATVLPELSKYRLTFVDVVHAVLSVLVFVAMAMRDKNVVSCFYPAAAREVQEVVQVVPVGIGVVCGLLFVVFPTRRHGIGYPVTRD